MIDPLGDTSRSTYLGRPVGLLMVVLHDRWPHWARPQLQGAIDLAATTAPGRTLATELYDRWFAGAVAAGSPVRPLAGLYRDAHAARSRRVVDGVEVLDRQDSVGADGWWRTWNTTWRPRHMHPRVLLSAQVGALDGLVAALTARLRDVPYLLACPTTPVRLERSGAVVLYLSRPLRREVVDIVLPMLREDTPPLCLPVAPGVAVAQSPDNGMTFGEHRCHLLALALGAPASRARALDAIADVFTRHGVDPSAPYRS